MATPSDGAPRPLQDQRWRRFAWRNLLSIVVTLFFAAAVVVAAWVTDRLAFVPAKREVMHRYVEMEELIPYNDINLISDHAAKLVKLRENISSAPDPEAVLGRGIMDAMERNSSLLRVELISDVVGTRVWSREDRMAKQNNWDNSLVMRDFRFTITRHPLGFAARRSAVLRIQVTVPNEKQIPLSLQQELGALTVQWRRTLAILVGIIAFSYLMLMHLLLLPIRRVLSTMDNPSGGPAPVIERPGTLVEMLFNDLARDASIARLAATMRESNDSRPEATAIAVAEHYPALAAAVVGLGELAVLAYVRSERETWVESARFSVQPGDSLGWIKGDRLKRAVTMTDFALTEAPILAEDGQVAFPVHEDGEHRLLLVVRMTEERIRSPWWRDFAGRLARELANAVEAAENRRKLILQQKSKANVSLSRNLGHDLTNIIATLKLELMTVRSLLKMDPAELAANPRKREIFAESLNALLGNVRFMQEIVNLYRSFAYLSRPTFEEVSLVELARDVAALFKLSMSTNFRLEVLADEGMAMLRVEPRLLRLALFNLLNNAMDAIKRASEHEERDGLIHITVRAGEAGSQELVVADSGTGIRDETGRLLDCDEIRTIFRLGYTTKGEDEGEGLGLNWVQTIIAEFHGGRIIARNRDEGGAEFVLILPEAPPAPRSSSPEQQLTRGKDL